MAVLSLPSFQGQCRDQACEDISHGPGGTSVYAQAFISEGRGEVFFINGMAEQDGGDAVHIREETLNADGLQMPIGTFLGQTKLPVLEQTIDCFGYYIICDPRSVAV